MGSRQEAGVTHLQSSSTHDKMMHMNELPTPITINELRTNMRNIVHRLMNDDTFTLTSYGQPVAVMVPIAEYHRLTYRRLNTGQTGA